VSQEAERTTDDLVICRCEEVTAGHIRAALSHGALTLSDVKRRTRAGMGVCQGIFCTRAIARVLRDEAGVPHDTILPMTARPPARVIPLAALADLDN
jgi:NAD(P)H-nitrite reductase large subunit